MAPTRKPQSRTAPAKTVAKHKSAKRRSVNDTFLRAKPASTTASLPEPPGFLIVGIGASAGGLEAMEQMTAQQGEGSGSVERNP